MYGELRAIAQRHLARSEPHTLQATALVNEAFVKLAGGELAIKERGHFAALVSRTMRQILVDHARRRMAERHGGGRERVSMADVPGEGAGTDYDLLALDEALHELVQLDATKARLVECRFFAGLTETEAAAALGISRSEATRQWRLTRAWLAHKLRGAGSL
jgi:RNA polymerase sigma factor (TIGR02999 family)